MQTPPQYFEGVLQLRNPTKEIIQFVRQLIASDGKAQIAKEKKLKNGVDIYISSQHYLQTLGRKLKVKFGGTLETSCRIQTCSHLTSKELYRVTVLFIPLSFSKGDVVRIHNELWKILLISNQVQLRNLKTGAKKWMKIEAVRGLQKVN